jgi:hypothetical protein
MMQQRAHCSRLRYDVSARLDVNIIATLPLWHSEEFQRQVPKETRDQMQEIA